MSQELRGRVKVADIYPLATVSGDSTGSGVDMRQDIGFEAALAMVSIGAITGTPTSLKVSFLESDASNLSNPTVVSGGAEVTVAADTAYQFQLKRSKRYIGMKVDFTGGTTPTAVVHAVALLNNWAKPFPLA